MWPVSLPQPPKMCPRPPTPHTGNPTHLATSLLLTCTHLSHLYCIAMSFTSFKGEWKLLLSVSVTQFLYYSSPVMSPPPSSAAEGEWRIMLLYLFFNITCTLCLVSLSPPGGLE